MTLTQLAAALNAASQDVAQKLATDPTAPVVEKPIAQFVSANAGYVFNTGVFTVTVILGSDPNVPGT